jgi:hypothetical protein
MDQDFARQYFGSVHLSASLSLYRWDQNQLKIKFARNSILKFNKTGASANHQLTNKVDLAMNS